MRKYRHYKIFNKRGFTLIEVLVVIAVMAILSAIVLPTMSSESNKQLQEKYKQSCLSVLESAEIITQAMTNGIRTVAGFTMIKSDGTVDYNEMRSCLKLENVNNASFEVIVFDVKAKNNGSNGNLPYQYVINKDLICIYICTNTLKNKFYPAGAVYYEVGTTKMSAKIKYDYVDNVSIPFNQDFNNPY